jgi:hypothetical protein|tara:strand:- start:397 stop:819 length:423 start_codon:yes stop_codon:yes gene_type:complete
LIRFEIVQNGLQDDMTIGEENEKLRADLTAGDILQTESAAQVEDLQAKVVALTDANTNAEAKTVALTEQHAAALEAERAKVDEIASVKALEIVAQQGAEPAEETDAPVAKTETQLWDEYATITDPVAKTNFYRAKIKPTL